MSKYTDYERPYNIQSKFLRRRRLHSGGHLTVSVAMPPRGAVATYVAATFLALQLPAGE